MPLTMAQSTDPGNVLGELKGGLEWKDNATKNNWSVNTFKFTQAPQDFYLKLKTRAQVKVVVKHEGGFQVYLQGEKETGGWAEQKVGTLPGKPST
jgi:hypothetical protein